MSAASGAVGRNGWPVGVCPGSAARASVRGTARAPGSVDHLARSFGGAPRASVKEPVRSPTGPFPHPPSPPGPGATPMRPVRAPLRCPPRRTRFTTGGTHVRADRSGFGPFVLLAAVMSLSWWEDRILPAPPADPVDAPAEAPFAPTAPSCSLNSPCRLRVDKGSRPALTGSAAKGRAPPVHRATHAAFPLRPDPRMSGSSRDPDDPAMIRGCLSCR